MFTYLFCFSDVYEHAKKLKIVLINNIPHFSSLMEKIEKRCKALILYIGYNFIQACLLGLLFMLLLC